MIKKICPWNKGQRIPKAGRLVAPFPSAQIEQTWHIDHYRAYNWWPEAQCGFNGPPWIVAIIYLFFFKESCCFFSKFMLPSSGNAPDFRGKVEKMNVEIMVGMVEAVKGWIFSFFSLSCLKDFGVTQSKTEKEKWRHTTWPLSWLMWHPSVSCTEGNFTNLNRFASHLGMHFGIQLISNPLKPM